jgi:hypothetical protein
MAVKMLIVVFSFVTPRGEGKDVECCYISQTEKRLTVCTICKPPKNESRKSYKKRGQV